MGSPSARLNTPEHLRAFVDSGLEFLYAPERAAMIAAAQAARPADSPRGASQPRTAPARPAPGPARPAGPSRAPGAVPPAPPQSSPRPAMQSAPDSGQARRAAPAGFPEPWASFLAKVAPSPRIVWTYMELGLDLAGQSDPRRAGVLRNLIAHLRWPRGTTAFWPVAALRNGALEPDAAMFWKGWEQWRTPHIACFGREALQVIRPEADGACRTCFMEHTAIHVLPSLSELVTMLPHEQQIAVDVLATLRMDTA